MRLPRGLRPEGALLGLSLLLCACGNSGDVSPPARTGTIGLYSSLPIAFNESEDIRGLLADDGPPHWALETLRARGKVVPLDTLAGRDRRLPLPKDAILILAQPRPLTAQENAALDRWVRGGGRVLMFVDPMLTAHSIFAPGDPRRPQDIAMLSPILARWGLELQFDDSQPRGERLVAGIPVDLAGRFVVLGKSGDAVADCRLHADGLIARCVSGSGRIVAVADAALLQTPENGDHWGDGRQALIRLLDELTVD